MQNLPAALLHSLQHLPGFQLEPFVAVHEQVQAPVSIRLHPHKAKIDGPLFENMQPIGWSQLGYYLPSRPSFAQHPLWHAGSFYVQEASSMVLEQVWNTYLLNDDTPKKILDLCAAPGGKSTHLLSLMSSTDLLVSNEVIGGRIGVLLENITRWGYANSVVTQNDPADYATLTNQFDVIVVDAPCSGSGLFRRDPNAINEWSEAAVDKCQHRQQRILADVWPALKENGLLIYATCSFSPQENEEMVDWLCDRYEVSALPVPIHADWGTVQSNSPRHSQPCYRFFPHLAKGEGFFLAVLRKNEPNDDASPYRPTLPPKQQIPVAALQQNWLNPAASLQFYQHKETLYAMPDQVFSFFLQWQKQLHIRKAGVSLGTWAHQGLQPDHAMAMSQLMHPDLPRIPLPLAEALQYLRKENSMEMNAPKGWCLPTFQGIPLGWIKHLGNRFNNYYPKDWRLRS